MKEILVQYASYNYWANQQITAVLQKLEEEEADKDLGGSFSTLRKLILHVWLTDSTWFQRLQLAEKPVDVTAGFNGSFADACKAWLKQSLQLQEWVKQATPARLAHTVAFTRAKSEHHKMEAQHIVMHVCNHSSFHRGQLVHMLRQLGVNKIPGTDYSSFIIKK
ncbi:MAG TPA: DinB family protein [Chitinophaga sp.]|uniref:DinB family protein n=1 Tax=Chitinophaga sp. TaxID=1869181 RepID=UPI002C20F3D0|nr:DinB family protein [Chitinophaga sp.]HVI46561.1 DinB family protein [Chitinophaga sp.]